MSLRASRLWFARVIPNPGNLLVGDRQNISDTGFPARRTVHGPQHSSMPPPSGFLPRVDTDWRERLKNPRRGDIISVRDVKEAEPK